MGFYISGVVKRSKLVCGSEEDTHPQLCSEECPFCMMSCPGGVEGPALGCWTIPVGSCCYCSALQISVVVLVPRSWQQRQHG